MPRGRRTSYTRDNRGRFASSPGGGAPKRSTPATRRAATKAGNRLNRDNSGRIRGIGRDGATVRGGRLKTAKGNRRATQLASMKAAGFRGGTIAKGGRGVRGTVAKPRGMKPGVLAARRGVKAKPSIPGFAPKDFERRASRAFYNTKNPKVKDRALALYKRMMDTSMTPLQVQKLMTTGKSYSTVKNKPKPTRQRLSKGEREHRDMLALAGKLFR